jgi:mannose-6-phosphate isomerase-like protein (cupin superfamily)
VNDVEVMGGKGERTMATQTWTVEELAKIGTVDTPSDDGVFNLRSPLLKQGITTDTRARTDHLRITIKVYANGGENLMHSHNHEDHAFVVLSGQATFRINTEDNVKVLNKWEGVMLPKDTDYKFESTGGDGHLVMLRIGAVIPGIEPVLKDLSFIPERIELPGMYFPDDCN